MLGVRVQGLGVILNSEDRAADMAVLNQRVSSGITCFSIAALIPFLPYTLEP